MRLTQSHTSLFWDFYYIIHFFHQITWGWRFNLEDFIYCLWRQSIQKFEYFSSQRLSISMTDIEKTILLQYDVEHLVFS